ncbi:MAG TPA: N-acetylmuramoyl-L-alanine amidase [Candidatus Marinimicrobia bacterium]|mgnify:CR=1 FL=1|nr:N-acetylmuramoyl-L-alanine amidase [Candidatus Neomarinimicrobiota bacterium]
MKKSLILLSVFLLSSLIYGQTAAFLLKDGARVESVNMKMLYGEEWISLNHFLKVFGSSLHLDKKQMILSANLNGKSVSFYAGSMFFSIDNQLMHLSTTTELFNDELYYPLSEYLLLLRLYFFSEMIYSPAEKGHILKPSGFTVQDITFREFKNGTIIRIQTTEKYRKEHCKLWEGPNNWLYFTLYEATADTAAFAKTFSEGTVREMVPIQTGESLQLSFRLRKKLSSYDFYIEENPRSIVITLRTPVTGDTQTQLLEKRSKWLIDTIVLDAGHGGKDPGAVAYDGTQEKMITLDVVKRLGKLLERNSEIKVVYTRTTDVFVPIKERTKIANQAGGKLFISVHCNSSRNRQAYGSETYLLSTEKNDRAVEVTELENKVIKFEENQEFYEKLTSEQHILAVMTQNQYQKESARLADFIEKKYIKKAHSKRTYSRGVKQAGFYVLFGASMPNVLTEIGFISNREDLRRLKTKEYRQKIAEAMYEAIMEFKEKNEQEIRQ